MAIKQSVSGALTAEIIAPYARNVTINITVRTGPSIELNP